MCLVNFFFKGVGRREVFFTPISPGGSQPPAATSRAFGFGTKYACLLLPKGIFVNHLLEKKVDKTYCMRVLSCYLK